MWGYLVPLLLAQGEGVHLESVVHTHFVDVVSMLNDLGSAAACAGRYGIEEVVRTLIDVERLSLRPPVVVDCKLWACSDRPVG